jgi:hypothetical protein
MTQITLQRGEYRVDRVTVTRSGVAVDLSGATVKLCVIPGWYPAGSVVVDTGALITKTVGSGITLSDPTNGIFDIEWLKADTSTIDFAVGRDALEYLWGIECIIPAIGFAEPVANGTLLVTPDVVRAI